MRGELEKLSKCLMFGFIWDRLIGLVKRQEIDRQKLADSPPPWRCDGGLLRPAAPFVPFEDAAEKRFALTPDPTSPSYVAPTEEEHIGRQYDGRMRFETMSICCCACSIQVCEYVASRCIQGFISVGHVWWPCLVISFRLPFTSFARCRGLASGWDGLWLHWHATSPEENKFCSFWDAQRPMHFLTSACRSCAKEGIRMAGRSHFGCYYV